MKKVIFLLFALLFGVGISAVLATDMQPPGMEITITAPAADVVSNEMPVPALMVVSPEVAATCLNFSFLQVSLDVESGSSGGISDLYHKRGEVKLQPCQWTLNGHEAKHLLLSDRTRCTQIKFSNIPVFAINCNFKFPL